VPVGIGGLPVGKVGGSMIVGKGRLGGGDGGQLSLPPLGLYWYGPGLPSKGSPNALLGGLMPTSCGLYECGRSRSSGCRYE
jgi:hypothetical protein